MQPRNFPAVAPVVLLLELELLDGVPDELQPAASSTLAVAAATAIIDLFNSDLLDMGSTMLPQRPPAPLTPQPARGTNVTPPTGIARRLALPAQTRKAVRDLLVMLMPN
jgi:hypothetical protein